MTFQWFNAQVDFLLRVPGAANLHIIVNNIRLCDGGEPRMAPLAM